VLRWPLCRLDVSQSQSGKGHGEKKLSIHVSGWDRIPEAHITISHFTVWVILTPVSFYYDDDNDHDCHQETALPAGKFYHHLSSCHFEHVPP
jgi:hypothetical protein